ncbi:hypothetical protein EKO27_g1269 [Xylaria grammica]|uniref:Uncharacterized protein n=1 Tax=Xylaria grammica TaxID=363999 RepID=A0A439DHF0_9PEZI|nr:hypothetical protein EKO27_g1269 [Xylaria grammica]
MPFLSLYTWNSVAHAPTHPSSSFFHFFLAHSGPTPGPTPGLYAGGLPQRFSTIISGSLSSPSSSPSADVESSASGGGRGKSNGLGHPPARGHGQLLLDIAIFTSIQNAARGDDKRLRDFLGSIMVVGGGSKIPLFTQTLEEKLRARRADLLDRILVSRSARDMDEQVVVWKGASVFAKLPANDSWITPFEFERLGARVLHHKVLWAW